jgi:hypothetical protein
MANSEKLITVRIWRVTKPVLEKLVEDYKKNNRIKKREGVGIIIDRLAVAEAKRRKLKI